LVEKLIELRPHCGRNSVVQSSNPYTSVTLNQRTATLNIGDALQLTATVQPAHATNRNIIWSSGDTIVAIVSNTGIVIGISAGTTTIAAKTAEGNHTSTTVITVGMPGNCNANTPGWGNSLGVVSFDSRGHNVIIQGTGASSHIRQIWSGAVTATNCQKTTFSGRESLGGKFSADCRSNPDFPGDLFSWCAVVRFADVLCPYPWRVPTLDDFLYLDVAMGDTEDWADDWIDDTPLFVQYNYINRWGGAFGGNGGMRYQGTRGFYWSQSKADEFNGFSLSFSSFGSVDPYNFGFKSAGFALRCVRDN